MWVFCNAKNLTCTPKNKKEKLRKIGNQTIPIPYNDAKIWSGKIVYKMCHFEIKS